MSYCRFNGKDSDVYVYGSDVYLICNGSCGQFKTRSNKEMIEHLLEHRRKGDKVPDRAIERLQKELDEHGDKYYV